MRSFAFSNPSASSKCGREGVTNSSGTRTAELQLFPTIEVKISAPESLQRSSATLARSLLTFWRGCRNPLEPGKVEDTRGNGGLHVALARAILAVAPRTAGTFVA